MNNKKYIKYNIPSNNSGFSIVELIVAVAIIAAVFTPVLKSFTTAAITNAKAQRTQDVTSVAERMMEEVKGYSVKDLFAEATTSSRKYEILFLSGDDAEGYLSGGEYTSDSDNYDEPPYVLLYKNTTATQGKAYDVAVKIDNEPYDNDASTNASNINSAALPQLYDIQDSKDHAVLSWEMSKYDSSAFNNLVEENTKKDELKPTIVGIVKDKGKKITEIILEDGPVVTETENGREVTYTTANIDCVVKYETGNETYTKMLEYDVYSSNLKNLKVDDNDKSNGGPHLYLFYKMGVIDNNDYKDDEDDDTTNHSGYMPHEYIDIIDTTSDGIHNVYLMLQNDGNLNDLKYSDGVKKADIELGYYRNKEKTIGGTVVKRTSDAFTLSQTHWDKNNLAILGNNEFYTNLTSNDVNIEQGKLYEVKKKNRVYKVTVSVYDGENLATELVSSMNAGDEAK